MTRRKRVSAPQIRTRTGWEMSLSVFGLLLCEILVIVAAIAISQVSWQCGLAGVLAMGLVLIAGLERDVAKAQMGLLVSGVLGVVFFPGRDTMYFLLLVLTIVISIEVVDSLHRRRRGVQKGVWW